MNTIWTALRSGGDYDAGHVEALREQLARVSPSIKLICLSDVVVPVETVPLKWSWPANWAKMEIFRPDIQGDVFYCDLSTMIVGDVRELVELSRGTILNERGADSSLMRLKAFDRALVWRSWTYSQQSSMDAHQDGTGSLLNSILGPTARRWSSAAADKVAIYSQSEAPPATARVVCFVGDHKPWLAEDLWVKAAAA